MKFLNIEVETVNKPVLDQGFVPLGAFIDSYLKLAKKPVSIAVLNSTPVSVYDTFIIGSPEYDEADYYYIERLVKLFIWLKGGSEVIIFGADHIAERLCKAYSATGARAFDYEFFTRIYEKEFVIRAGEMADKPVLSTEGDNQSAGFGRNLNGCRIGFDAGGSDRKVSAIIDGEAVFSEEVVWHPKENSDPKYHYDGIVSAFKTAASKMPRVDAIGVSSAGIYVDNRAMAASLFIKIPNDVFDREVRDIYIRAAKEIGNVPLSVANDGDVTALAGAMDLNDTNVLGIAMGTSQAAGYIDGGGNITGWLNELAFVPVDCQPEACVDEWSGDIGCGVKYFSQDGVIKLAEPAGITLDGSLTLAEKLKAVQKLMSEGNMAARYIYESIGVYLGHSINLYSRFYNIRHILLLGRVMSGEGGAVIVNEATRVLNEEYPELAAKIKLHLPDEKSRRVGQSVAAASLPSIN